MALQLETDEALAGQVKRADHSALAELIKRYQQKLYHYVTRLIGNADEAEDVVQETFLRVYKNIQSFDEEKKFSSWIYRIAHNTAINAIKKRQRLQSVEALTLDWLQENQEEAEDFIATEERRALSENMIILMDDLRAEYREALVLYYFEEKSYQEISEIMHIPEATVGVWLRRAKITLKERIEKYERKQ
ncbi:MAG: RNA polymerase sigma factor [Candidatus Falkowbacteria bacterium]